MDIKDFKKGQSAYMLRENRGYNKRPEVKEVTVLSVGKKFVVVNGDIRFEVFSADDGYLKEHTEYGDRRLLFVDEKEVSDHLEWMELDIWLYKNESKMHQLSLRQLRAIKKIVEEPEQKTVMLNFDRSGSHKSRHFTVDDSEVKNVCAMVEKARQLAFHDGCTGWLSEMPASYFERAGFHPVDVTDVVMDDISLVMPEYKKNGYSRLSCKDCRYCTGTLCIRYNEAIDPDDQDTCYDFGDKAVYEMHDPYAEEGEPLFYFCCRDKDGDPMHTAEQIFRMFASTDNKLTAMLNEADFDADALFITDEDGYPITQDLDA